MAKNKSQYDSTLNLPKTLFEMRAGLPKKEPVMLKDWDDNDLYNQLMKHNEGKPQFILHDGPPYANGNIHMGTALNKIIKDIIIREKNMEGYQAPYVPGFDTHGLPIELKALSSVGDKKKDISKLELRQICEKFATEHIDIMSDQFKRLGVIGDFEHPYLTLKPEFEARQIEIFGEMAKKGYIYKGLKPVYWSPVFVADGKEVLSGSYYVLFCYSMVSIVLFLKEYVADRRKCVGAAEKAVWFSGGVFAVLYLILIGLFGVEALAQMKFPAVTMMSRVQVTGGFLKRTDAFMFSIWFFTLYAMLNSMVFYSGNLTEKVIRDCGGYLEGKKRMLPYLILLLLVYGVAVLFYRNQQILDSVTFLLWKIGTPFVVGVPVLLCLTGERKKHNKKVRVLVLVCFLFGCLFLQGCNVAELEDKAFPVLLNIRDQDDFQNVWLNHEYAGNKEVDYNHLKVVLIERSFLEKEAEVEDMLSMLEQGKEVPWNAYVMTTESCDRLAQTDGELDVLLGNYLEELLENTSGIDQKAYPTLGMLYEERANHLETLYIPFVDIEGEQSGAVQDDTGRPQITAYEVWKRGRAVGLVDTDTARAAFFTQNFADDYTLQLAPELYVKVDAASCRVKETEKIGAGGLTEQVVTVTVTGEGEILSGTVSASENPANSEAGNTETNITNTSYEKMTRKKEQIINTRMEDYLNAIAAHALEKEIDITNSYRNLGADNRTWYFKYQNTPAAYEKDIKIQYLVKINWKSE